jgi:DNA-binding MarR family transcriptional regulator
VSADASPALSPERTAQLDELRLAFSALLAAERRLRARQVQEHGGRSVAQMRAIMALGREGSATPGELAIASDLRPASVTAMLDHMEADGLIERSRDPEDGRRVIVTLTAAGNELLDHKREKWRRFGDEALADLSDTELGAAIRALRALADGVTSLAHQD